MLRYKRPTLNLGGKTAYDTTWDIGDEVYELKFVQKLPDKAAGLCDPSKNTMYIKLKQSRIETWRTFIHEAIHAMEDIYDFELKHDDVDKLEVCLSDFLIDNAPSLAKILFP